MRTKKFGLLAILLGILVIPFMTAKAADIEERYVLDTSGYITITKGEVSDSISYNNGELDATKFKTKAELDKSIDLAKTKLIKWASDNKVTEDGYHIAISGYDIKKKINDEGYEVTAEDDGDYSILEHVTTVTLYGALDDKKAITKVEINGATLSFNVGDKPVFTGKVTSDLYSIEDESWVEYSSDSKISGSGTASYVSSNEEYNKDAKEQGILIEKFLEGKRYSYGFSVRVKDFSKYKFTKNTKFYVNGKEYKRPDYYGSTGEESIFLSNIVILDFASKTIEEKNSTIANVEAQKVIGTAGLYEHPGMTDELAGILLDALESDKQITTKLNITEISDADKKEIDEKIKDKVTPDMKIVSYLDITIPVSVDGENVGLITKLKNNIKITVKAPENVPAVKEGYERTYSVIRLHDGEIVILPVTVNADGTLSFESDSFSDYILTYTDNATEKIVNPNTGDNVSIWFVFGLLSLVGLVSLRKLRENK